MGACSTIRITRTKARMLLVNAVLKADDNVLEEMLDPILRKRLYNCRIVSDGEPNDDERMKTE